ncbi:MAG: M48 family metalloprotease, partial [Xanthomonadales bacterium]|nr:M48 family metalloprotease [Xanthomonadales bacterium]
VIAHEFSHILNGDMRLNIRLMGLLFGILVLAIIGRRVLIHGRGVRSKDGAPVFMIALALMVLGYAGVFFGRLIKAGVSRQREYLADASAVQFTRQTSGIAGALKKIAGIQEGSKLQAADGEEVSHMLFGDGVGYSSLFATHPPLLARIQALDPGFKPDDVTSLRQQFAAAPPSGLDEDLAMGFAADGRTSMPHLGDEVSIAAERVADQVAEPAVDDFQRAGGIVAALPAPLRRAAESREQAMPLVMSLLLDGDDGIRERQLAAIAAELGPRESERTAALFGDLPGLHPMQRMPLAALAFPRLRREPRPTLLRFISVIETLVHADGEVQPFEYCLSKLLQAQVWEALDPARRRPRGSHRLHALRDQAAALLSVLAKVGHSDDMQAQRAFAAAWEHLFPGSAERYAPPADWRHALDEALLRLDRLLPSPKQLLIESMTVAISQDGRVSVAEAELLRTTCACLHCPLPPMLER